MTKSLDEIRGSLTQFKKLLDVVNFALESHEGHAARESRMRELTNLIESATTELEGLQGDIKKAKDEHRNTVQKTDIQRKAGEEIADQIVAKGQEDAKKLVDDAQADVDQLVEQKTELQGEVKELKKEVDKINTDKGKAQKELDAVTESLQSALDRVKPPGKD